MTLLKSSVTVLAAALYYLTGPLPPFLRVLLLPAIVLLAHLAGGFIVVRSHLRERKDVWHAFPDGLWMTRSTGIALSVGSGFVVYKDHGFLSSVLLALANAVLFLAAHVLLLRFLSRRAGFPTLPPDYDPS